MKYQDSDLITMKLKIRSIGSKSCQLACSQSRVNSNQKQCLEGEKLEMSRGKRLEWGMSESTAHKLEGQLGKWRPLRRTNVLKVHEESL